MKYHLVLLFLISSTTIFAIEPPSTPKYGIEMKEARIPMPAGIPLAADQGVQYASNRYTEILKHYGIKISMSRMRIPMTTQWPKVSSRQ